MKAKTLENNPYNFPYYNRNKSRVVNECTHVHNPLKGDPRTIDTSHLVKAKRPITKNTNIIDVFVGRTKVKTCIGMQELRDYLGVQYTKASNLVNQSFDSKKSIEVTTNKGTFKIKVRR